MDMDVTNESHVESHRSPNESPTSASEADQQNNTNVSTDVNVTANNPQHNANNTNDQLHGTPKPPQIVNRNGNEPAQRRLHSLKAQQELLKPIENIRQQHPAGVQSLLEQQQQQFLKWQQQLQQQQQQQFLLWLQKQQRKQQQQNKQNSEPLERLEKMVHEIASMIKQWIGDRSTPQLHSNASASQ
ncbi:ras-interacting protein RIP3-like [Drosophila virilis]|uniref:ras-interacting protein RIP3-like n=1 Tax=Drosophila virilis TaxID=7244 RepID=UPI0038B29610